MGSIKFKDVYKDFLTNLNENDKKAFDKLSCDESRLNFVYNLPFVHKYNVSTLTNSKSSSTAKQTKEDGNLAFQGGKYKSALELYSTSVINQPQNTSIEKEELSVVIANRSAALYHLQEHQLALEDIQSALDFNYPTNLQYKIYDRKARCLLALNQLQSAKDTFRKTLQALDAAKLSVEKRQKWQRDVQIMLAMLDKNKELANAKLKKQSTYNPQFNDGTNKLYPNASSAVAIKDSEKVGRFAEANRDIKPGEMLVKEKPHCAVLLDKYSKTHCFHCFCRTRAPFPCPSCSNVVFCSNACQSRAQQTHHKFECAILPILWDAEVSITCLMALRIITQRNLQFFVELKPRLMNVPKDTSYMSSDYIRVYNLVNHSSLRSSEDFLHRTVMTIFLLQCLQKTNYFYQEDKANGGKLMENVKYIGGLILRHLQSLQFNSHEVSELVVKGDNKQSVFIGGAVYPTLALFNHSCNPGVVRYHKGSEVFVRAIRTIRQGEMVAENYGPIFTQVEKSERQLTLKTQYWFSCECEACAEDWPTLKDMRTDVMRFRCDCGSIIIVPVDTQEFMLKCFSCDEHLNILKGLKILQDTDIMFRVAKSLTIEGKVLEALQKFLEVLNLLDTTLAPPFLDYHVCQQEIRTYMLTCGNIHNCDKK